MAQHLRPTPDPDAPVIIGTLADVEKYFMHAPIATMTKSVVAPGKVLVTSRANGVLCEWVCTAEVAEGVTERPFVSPPYRGVCLVDASGNILAATATVD